MSVSTLRVRVTEDVDYYPHLEKAFARLYTIYPDAVFEVVVTANCVLQGNANDRYSCWHGLDYSSRRNFEMNEAQEVHFAGDVANLRVDWDLEDFSNAFYSNMPDSDVTVHSLINLVFIIRKFMDNFEDEMQIGRQLTRLY